VIGPNTYSDFSVLKNAYSNHITQQNHVVQAKEIKPHKIKKCSPLATTQAFIRLKTLIILSIELFELGCHSNVSWSSAIMFGIGDRGAEIARPDIARPDNPAPCRA